jgi:hypothetical protein
LQLFLGKANIFLSFQVTSASLPISITKAAGEISGNSSNDMLSWLSCHKDFEQSFFPASKTKLAKKIAPMWKYFTLIQALLMTSPCHHGKQTKSFVLVTSVVQ